MDEGALNKDPKFIATKVQLSKTINSELLDYKHHHPSNLLETVQTLRKIIGNVLKDPSEQKFRKVRASNPKFQQTIQQHAPALKFLTLAGWRTKVENLEKYWHMNADPDTVEYRVLEEAHRILEKAEVEVKGKSDAARKASDKKAIDEKERARIRNVLADDAERRSERQQQEALALQEREKARLLKEEQDRKELAERKALEEERLIREQLAAAHGGKAPVIAASE